MDIAFSSSFKRAFKKRIKNKKEIEELFWESIALFIQDPFHPLLKTHKLSGNLKNLWSFSVTYDVRVIFSLKITTKKQFSLI